MSLLSAWTASLIQIFSLEGQGTELQGSFQYLLAGEPAYEIEGFALYTFGDMSAACHEGLINKVRCRIEGSGRFLMHHHQDQYTSYRLTGDDVAKCWIVRFGDLECEGVKPAQAQIYSL